MTTYIYDIEVFSDDWIVVFKRPEPGAAFIVIHNDNYHLREFIAQSDIIIGGFNNKHYDNWIILTMLLGGSNVEVKRHNDFILSGGDPWSFPFVQFKKLPCPTFDLRDDIADPGISLKAIEGNLKLPIVESSVSFDIDRPLTKQELDEVILYCKTDVDATIELYNARKSNYLDAKILVGEMYDVPPEEALGMTNAKLSARVLEAKNTSSRDDERNYVLPDNLDPKYIPKVIYDFFMQIRDKSIPDAKLFGNGKGAKGMTLDVMIKTSFGECPVTYAWGGVHGAKPCITIEETEDRVIINQDVASLYPNSMINFGYCSRNMADPSAYAKLIEKRLGYKKSGDKLRAGALKLVVNSTYGAMLNYYNDLADRWAGRSVCITNQLAMTILIVLLAESCATIDFININTDGIMFTIDRSEVDLSENIVREWCDITKFEMERDDFKKVIQKDVNNYIGIKPDGKFKTKGGYVSLYDGGNFKTNSLQIVHKAIVEYLVNQIPPEDTIRDCTDIFAFQQIIKTGGTFEGAYHYINGERVQVQKVNRIYAVNDPRYGQLVKGKLITQKRKKNAETGKMDVIKIDPPIWSETIISECPEHCFIDNENVLTVNDLDLNYYINMAKNRIDKYINVDPKVERKISKIKKEVAIMAKTTVKTAPSTKSAVATTEDGDLSFEVGKSAFSGLNVYQKLIYARKMFQSLGVKKSGINRFAEFDYFELEDIVPPATEIFSNLGLLFVVTFTNDNAIGVLFNTDKPEEFIEFNSPMRTLENKKMNEVQALGGVETYQRRYLYMACLDIVENDAIDAAGGKDDKKSGKGSAVERKTTTKPATADERKKTAEELIDKGGEMSKTQKTAISKGLKKLRARYMDENKKVFDEAMEERYDAFIRKSAKAVKNGLTKTEAEDLLIEIGNKLNEE